MSTEPVNAKDFMAAIPTIYPQGPLYFLEMLDTMPDEHPADHEFKAGAIPGVCYECGFIEKDVPTTCHCGNDLRWHAINKIAPALMEAMFGPSEEDMPVMGVEVIMMTIGEDGKLKLM